GQRVLQAACAGKDKSSENSDTGGLFRRFYFMALLPILYLPDPKLHTVAKPVGAVDARIKELVGDMLETMYEADGIGLAATQVDVHERVVVIDVSEQRNQPLVLINTEIHWAS